MGAPWMLRAVVAHPVKLTPAGKRAPLRSRIPRRNGHCLLACPRSTFAGARPCLLSAHAPAVYRAALPPRGTQAGNARQRQRFGSSCGAFPSPCVGAWQHRADGPAAAAAGRQAAPGAHRHLGRARHASRLRQRCQGAGAAGRGGRGGPGGGGCRGRARGGGGCRRRAGGGGGTSATKKSGPGGQALPAMRQRHLQWPQLAHLLGNGQALGLRPVLLRQTQGAGPPGQTEGEAAKQARAPAGAGGGPPWSA